MACLVQTATSAPSGAEKIATVRSPCSSTAPTTTWTRCRSSPVSTSGALSVSSTSRGASRAAPPARASSTNPVPGKRTVSRTRWSAIHGWVAAARTPVKTVRSPSAAGTQACRIGWPVSRRPAAARLPVERAGPGQ